MVIKIEHDTSGKVTGVVYADESGAMQRQKARVVAVAGNSIESPRLLLNSASTMFPDGLANSSGQVGRNYMRHMTGSVYAAFEKSVHMYRGTTMAGIIRDEAKNDPKRGFVGGYEMETLSIGVPFMAAFLNPGAWGRPFTSAMESYPRMAGMWLVGEDMPQETNRITLDPKAKDKFGMPVASVHFDDHPNDVAMRDHAYKQGAAVYEAVGATVTYPTPPYPSTHNLGTNRMSEKPRDGVVNKFGQAHDVKNLFISDGSQFTSGAACNPTLTIVSLAIRQADHIAGAMQRKESPASRTPCRAASLEITVHRTFADFEERSNVPLAVADANARHDFSSGENGLWCRCASKGRSSVSIADVPRQKKLRGSKSKCVADHKKSVYSPLRSVEIRY